MALTVKVRTERVTAAAEQLQNAAGRYGTTVENAFDSWADAVRQAMWEETPKDTQRTADSITIERSRRGTRQAARIGPTNTDDKGRPIGFYLNYGAAGRAPADFIWATRNRAVDMDIDVGSVL